MTGGELLPTGHDFNDELEAPGARPGGMVW